MVYGTIEGVANAYLDIFETMKSAEYGFYHAGSDEEADAARLEMEQLADLATALRDWAMRWEGVTAAEWEAALKA